MQQVQINVEHDRKERKVENNRLMGVKMRNRKLETQILKGKTG